MNISFTLLLEPPCLRGLYTPPIYTCPSNAWQVGARWSRFFLIYSLTMLIFQILFWLVVYLPLWKLYEFVSWDKYSQHYGEIETVPVTTNQFCMLIGGYPFRWRRPTLTALTNSRSVASSSSVRLRTLAFQDVQERQTGQNSSGD